MRTNRGIGTETMRSAQSVADAWIQGGTKELEDFRERWELKRLEGFGVWLRGQEKGKGSSPSALWGQGSSLALL